MEDKAFINAITRLRRGDQYLEKEKSMVSLLFAYCFDFSLTFFSQKNNTNSIYGGLTSIIISTGCNMRSDISNFAQASINFQAIKLQLGSF